MNVVYVVPYAKNRSCRLNIQDEYSCGINGITCRQITFTPCGEYRMNGHKRHKQDTSKETSTIGGLDDNIF